VEGLAQVLAGPFGGAAAAAAIVLGTVLLRLVLLPVGYLAHRGGKRRGALVEKANELRERHGGDRRRLEAELAGLYRTQGGGLLLGCLPLLVQLPLFAGLYRVFSAGRIGGHANALLHQHLFGLPLGTHLLAATGSQLPVFGVLLALLAAVGLASSRLLRPTGPMPGGVASSTQRGTAGSTQGGTASPAPAGAAGLAPGGAVALVAKVLPYASLVSAAVLPFAAGLYLLTTTACTVAQTVALRHWGG
jgi:YidC/Oxa1 family membrane protein insertase